IATGRARRPAKRSTNAGSASAVTARSRATKARAAPKRPYLPNATNQSVSSAFDLKRPLNVNSGNRSGCATMWAVARWLGRSCSGGSGTSSNGHAERENSAAAASKVNRRSESPASASIQERVAGGTAAPDVACGRGEVNASTPARISLASAKDAGNNGRASRQRTERRGWGRSVAWGGQLGGRRRVPAGGDRGAPRRSNSRHPPAGHRQRRIRARRLERVHRPPPLQGLLRAPHPLVLLLAGALLPLVPGGRVVRRRPAFPDLRPVLFARAHGALGRPGFSPGAPRCRAARRSAGGALLRRPTGAHPQDPGDPSRRAGAAVLHRRALVPAPRARPGGPAPPLVSGRRSLSGGDRDVHAEAALRPPGRLPGPGAVGALRRPS